MPGCVALGVLRLVWHPSCCTPTTHAVRNAPTKSGTVQHGGSALQRATLRRLHAALFFVKTVARQRITFCKDSGKRRSHRATNLPEWKAEMWGRCMTLGLSARTSSLPNFFLLPEDYATVSGAMAAW